MSEKATLRDVLNYEPEQYLTKDEMALIQSTFGGNNTLIKILRKVFLPTAFDPELPIEEMQKDAWMADKDFSMMQNEEIKSIVLARQDAIKFILGGLINLKVIANAKAESEAEELARKQKDSAK